MNGRPHPHCPAKGNPCTGTTCGHCPKCTHVLDNHNALSVTTQGRTRTTCPKG